MEIGILSPELVPRAAGKAAKLFAKIEKDDFTDVRGFITTSTSKAKVRKKAGVRKKTGMVSLKPLSVVDQITVESETESTIVLNVVVGKESFKLVVPRDVAVVSLDVAKK